MTHEEADEIMLMELGGVDADEFEALKKERDAYREALKIYANKGQWLRKKEWSRFNDLWLSSEHGYKLATDVLAKFKAAPNA